MIPIFYVLLLFSGLGFLLRIHDREKYKMTHEQYTKLRKKVGTQQRVADLLGVHQVTIARRETGALLITKEAEFAIRWLSRHPTRTKL